MESRSDGAGTLILATTTLAISSASTTWRADSGHGKEPGLSSEFSDPVIGTVSPDLHCADGYPRRIWWHWFAAHAHKSTYRVRMARLQHLSPVGHDTACTGTERTGYTRATDKTSHEILSRSQIFCWSSAGFAANLLTLAAIRPLSLAVCPHSSLFCSLSYFLSIL